MGESRMHISPLPILPAGWRSPSNKEGMDAIDEDVERYVGCIWIDRLLAGMSEFTQRTKIHACSHYYFHAFYNHRSFKMQDKGVVGLSSIFLACKVLENTRKMKDLQHCYQLEIAKAHPGVELMEKEQFELREEITRIESFLLRIVHFNFSPPTDSFDKLEELIIEVFKKTTHLVAPYEPDQHKWQMAIMTCARSFLCDAYRVIAVHLHQQHVLAYACLRMACFYQQKSFHGINIILQQWDTIFPEHPSDGQTDQVKKDILQVFRMKSRLSKSQKDDSLTLPDQRVPP
eukprot:GEMP01058773.1.p1 GENE.GEMP01058773.1~~GEMP01058773.1.p1  ORF type:complete len:306 (+),score=32.84 GEMP01058773.1:56-919(+)